MSAVPPTFQPGQTVLHRGFVGDRLIFLRVARVVGADERGLRIWIPNGTPMVVSVAEDGRGIRDMPFEEWIEQRQTLRITRWRGPDIFMLIPDCAGHSIWWFWDPRDGEFAGWYINLEEPSVCWSDGELSGVDTTDQDLDVWVYPDRSWEWKDEDEVAERSAFPEHYWVRDTAAVRAEGEQVVKLVEAGLFPFDGTWRDYRPPAEWSQPVALPVGWDRARYRR